MSILADIRPLFYATIIPALLGILVVMRERWSNGRDKAKTTPTSPSFTRTALAFFVIVLALLYGASLLLDLGLWSTRMTFTGPFWQAEPGSRMLVMTLKPVKPKLRMFQFLSNRIDTDHLSRFRLFVNGVERQPPHVQREDIRAGNQGFNHIKGYFYFALAPGEVNESSLQTEIVGPLTVRPDVKDGLLIAVLSLGTLWLFLFRPRFSFLVIQLGLIYLCGFGSAAGIGVILCLLLFYAFFLKRVRRLWVPALVTFFAYWIAQKYLVPFLGVPGPPFGGEQGLLVMLGISYMGFKLIHFVADQREGAIRSWSVVEFLNWMFFLPTLVAGPMQRFQDWEAQRTSPRRLEAADWVAGINQILIGLFLKLVVADTIHGATLAKMSDGVLDTADFSQLAFGAILYYIYLYCDFSGYTRIAIGIGRFWGLRIPENFNFPFLARNLAEFWNRYHITLSELLRDYLFYPLSLSLKRQPLARRFPALATVIPPLVTFILAGIWHGAGIGFALYGLVHGIGLSYLALAKRRGARTMFGKWWEGSTLGHVAGVALTFCYVSFSYIFFCLDGPRLALLAARLWP